MQCPNCRKIEKGNWLYSNGSSSLCEINMEDVHDQNLDGHSGQIHPCPYILNWTGPDALVGAGAFPNPLG